MSKSIHKNTPFILFGVAILLVALPFIVAHIVVEKIPEKKNINLEEHTNIQTNELHQEEDHIAGVDSKPTTWFIQQRIYPHEQFNFAAFWEAKHNSLSLEARADDRAWQFVGPTNIGGRVCDVEMDHTNPNIAYFAAAAGGIFKTVDRGKTWFPIFDEQLTLNMGDICIAPSDPNVLYVGTGEVNPGGGSITYPGLGVYKSIDGGNSWQHMGLEATHTIGRVKIDPTDHNIVYVAATGRLYGENEERGVYKSIDGGNSWQKVLFVSGKTGCIDLAINPQNPNIIYAAMWQRIRKPGYQKYGGPESGIYRSQDGGNTWQKLANGLPNSDNNTGRIGIDICNSQPNTLYTCYATTDGDHLGVFKTTDGGNSWKKTNDNTLKGGVGTYAWWFSNIRIDPNNPNVVFFLGFSLYRSQNGGGSWQNVDGGMHPDHHGLFIHPLDSNICMSANDGGLYVSTNGGSQWTRSESLPITQFYSLAVDPNNPNRILAGAQDNGVNFVTDGGKSGWKRVIGGDGLDVAFDPTDSRYAYGESQYGAFSRSSNGGNSFGWGGSGISGNKGWKCPIVVDSTNGDVYFGTDKVYRSTDHGSFFSEISPNLTSGDDRDPFRTVTSIAISASNNNYIYAGTDNGNIWVSKNHGKNWEEVSSDLPPHWITSLEVDAKNPEKVYATISGYRWDKELPHIFMTDNAGKNWSNISGNLPDAPINGVVADSRLENVLYVASDMGVYFTINSGNTWSLLGKGLPRIIVHEICLHSQSATLYAATFGRGIYKMDVSSIGNVEKSFAEKEAAFDFGTISSENDSDISIHFSVAISGNVRIEIFSLEGNKITELFHSHVEAGNHSAVWNKTNASGEFVKSGYYVCRLWLEKQMVSKKLFCGW